MTKAVTKRNREKAQHKAQTPATPYQPTEWEAAAVKAHGERNENRRPRPLIKVVEVTPGQISLASDHADKAVGGALLCNSLGSASGGFVHTLIESLAQATAKGGQVRETALNNTLALVQGLEPQDEAEAMLAAQMAMVHQASMHAARRLQHCDTLQQLEAHDRCLNRLTRTYAAQMEALKRYRSGGQQRMTVEHVHVHEGGQAIVGSVHHGGGGLPPKLEPTT